MTPSKGRSRLKKSPSRSKEKGGPRRQLERDVATPHRLRYLRHLPLLLLGALFFGLTGFILRHVQPDSIRDVVVPTAYAPLLATVFLGTFFGGAFVLLHSRRGLLLAVGVTGLLFLRLQAVELSSDLVLIFYAILIGFELLAIVVGKLRG